MSEDDFRSVTAANEALSDMPPRLEEELDAVTLHNQALLGTTTTQLLYFLHSKESKAIQPMVSPNYSIF